MKRLVLLAGLHKTGSTSIQLSCVRNQRALAAQAFSYFPEVQVDGRFTSQGSGNHSRLLRAAFRRSPLFGFERNRYEESRSTVTRIMRGLLGKANGTVLMVAEAVSAFDREELQALKKWFLDSGFEIQTMCCVRRPADWLTSMVAQRVAGERGPRLAIDAAVQEFVEAQGLVVPRIRALAEVFPTTDFFSFQQALGHPHGPVGFFLERIGFRTSPGLEILRANEGKSVHSVRLQSMINGTIGPRSASVEHDNFYSAFRSKNPALGSIPGEKFALLEGEVAPLLGMLEEENRWLKDRFGAGFHDEALYFGSGPVLLNPDQREILRTQIDRADSQIGQILSQYLAAH